MYRLACLCVQARKNREISLVQRKLDEVPSRIELSQYQKRLVELINQGGGGARTQPAGLVWMVHVKGGGLV